MSTWYLFICNVEDSMADTNKNHTNKQTNKITNLLSFLPLLTVDAL
jgi:hypothetical protein